MTRVVSPLVINSAALVRVNSGSLLDTHGINTALAELQPPRDALVAQATGARRPPPEKVRDEVDNAFYRLTDIGWILSGRTPPMQALTNAQALLKQHNTALQGPGDKLTRYGGDKMTSNNWEVREYGSPNVQKDKDPEWRQIISSRQRKIESARQTLRNAGYDLKLVQSPRVQALVAADIMLATWNGLRTADGKPVSKQDRNRINDLVAARKSEFVRALRDYDQASLAHKSNPGKPETTRLTYEKNRLEEADTALHAVMRALYDQVSARTIDMKALQPQFGSHPPLDEGVGGGT